MKKKNLVILVPIVLCVALLCFFLLLFNQGEEEDSGKEVYSESMLPVELNSIKTATLSPEHEYYGEVVEKDPECAAYIKEISIFDKEIGDTFIIHLSLPPEPEENKLYPLVVETDGVWRLNDHLQFRDAMASGEMEKFIIISIGYPNGYDYGKIRERDLVHEPESYLHFIMDNLIPYILSNYPVSTENMTLTGHSYGGYFAYYALFHHDTIVKKRFANYCVASPSLQASTKGRTLYDFETEYIKRTSELKAKVYVSAGSYEDFYFVNAIETFTDKVINRKYEELDLRYELHAGFSHNQSFQPSIQNSLKWFYGIVEEYEE